MSAVTSRYQYDRAEKGELAMDKEKLRRLIEQGHDYYYSDAYNGLNVYEAIAEYLIMKGVRLKGGTDDGT